MKKFLKGISLGVAFIAELYCAPVFALEVGLKISAAENWNAWGDYILGQDLKSGVEALGYQVKPSYIGNYYPEGSQTTDIDIYMHGFIPFNPPKDDKFKVLYLYYPLETANTEKFKNIESSTEPEWYSLETELWDYDLVAVASPVYQKEIERLGIKTVFVPQFTNAQKFYYEYDANVAHDILFVGRPGYERISAKWAIESGFDVALYGDGWQTKAPLKYFKGNYIDNNELHKYYASAKIVLNDTRPDMKAAGFISNRVFDVTASGGFLISDYMPEIEQFYGDTIPMFKTKEELAELLTYYLSHPEEREKKAKAAQQVTLKHFTNIAAAKKIFSALKTRQNLLDTNKLVLQFPWDENSTYIGDYWLGQDLEKGLKASGLEVKSYYYHNGFGKDTFYNQAQNLLYMQFKFNHIDPSVADKTSILYLYFPTFVPERGKFKNSEDKFTYNTDAFLNNELEYFDMIATPAKAVYGELKARGYKATFVPQFTNPDKFSNAPDENLKTDLLFVGSTWYDRVSARYAAELGYDLSVYGLNWEGKIDPKYLKGTFIDNKELHRYYSSAKIVLSDHAEDLGAMGLVVNRLFDATAVGAFVISEYSPYIEEIFGDTVPMFKDKQEFKQLVDFYLAHPEARQEKAKAAQAITLKNYTNAHIGQKIKSLFSLLNEVKK